MSLLFSILLNAVTRPNRLAVVDDRGSFTYRQITGAAYFIAEQIRNTTVNANVGLLLPTSGGFAASLIGCWLTGRVPVPLNYLLRPDELIGVIADSQIDTIITVGPMLDFLGGAQWIPKAIRLIRLEQMDFGGKPVLRFPPLLHDSVTAAILYTSGTSGQPKGVVLSHGNLHSNVRAAVKHAQLTEAHTFLGVLPQFHSFGLTALTLVPLAIGAKVVYTARFIPLKIMELMRLHRPDVFMAVPAMYNALLSLKDAGPDDFRSIQLAISGGEALPRIVFDTYLHRFNLTLLEGYGLTETSPVTHWSIPSRRRPGSVGTSLPHVRTMIVDESLRQVPLGTEGEVLLAGPNIMQGYYRRPDLTAEVIVELPQPCGNRLRAFRTGDIGKVDADGFLYLTGRKKELFKVAGEMVAPREIEEVINRFPGIRASVVLPRHDGVRGLVPVAVVELDEGVVLDETAVRTWCRQHLAHFKVPREIRRITTIPRSGTGKVLRREMNVEQLFA